MTKVDYSMGPMVRTPVFWVIYALFVTVAAAGLPMLTPRTLAILSFALCGFANFASIAVLTGGFSAVAPERRSEVARYGLRVVLAGTLSNLMSATIAGMFLTLH